MYVGVELVADSPYYPTFVFEKLKMDMVISESALLKNGSVNYPNPFYKYKYKCGIEFLREYEYGNGNIHIQIKLRQESGQSHIHLGKWSKVFI
jgi:hypothetical protein